MATEPPTSPSSFSLLRLNLPQNRHQDVAFVFHGTPTSSDTAVPLSLHLGAGKRSWRSEHVADLDSDAYVPSADAVQARPCEGLMERFASPPSQLLGAGMEFKDMPAQSGPRIRTGNSRRLAVLLAYMLVCVITIPMLTAWCHPAVNPDGVCRAVLYRASPSIESLHSRLPTWLANRVPVPPPRPPPPAPVSSPVSSPAPVASPVNARSVILDIVPELTTLLEDSQAQLNESVLVVSLRPAEAVPEQNDHPTVEEQRQEF
ncbi:hypothetical protein F5X98DRAFT_379296 [Xylaria grammica]|nr:hypothetical protein F5X98DRAFT_379296 [Xylaria grammica]